MKLNEISEDREKYSNLIIEVKNRITDSTWI